MNEDDISEFLEELKDGDKRVMPSEIVKSKFNEPTTIENNSSIEVSLKESDKHEINVDEAEKNIRVLIEYGNEAIKNLSDLAEESQHPRGYEALASLMKTVLDANSELGKIRKKDKLIVEQKTTKENRLPENEKIISVSVSELLRNM